MTEIKDVKFTTTDVLKALSLIMAGAVFITSMQSSLNRTSEDIKEVKTIIQQSINKSDIENKVIEAKVNELNLRITIIEKKLEKDGANR